MRTLTTTLLAAQKPRVRKALAKIVLTSGETTKTYQETGANPILDIKHPETPWNQTAQVELDNSDGTLTDLDLKGYKGVISYGAETSASDEYSATAPMWVIGYQLLSWATAESGRLTCVLSLAGIPNLLGVDVASEAYTPDDTDTKTVKTLIREIAGDTGATILTCYNHCTHYDVVFDSEDALIDVFQPKDGFKIYVGGNRRDKIKELLEHTKCVARFEDDGKIHIFVPVISTSTAWEANTEYAVGATVVPTVANEVEYKRTVAADYVTGTAEFTTDSDQVVGTDTVFDADHIGRKIQLDADSVWHTIGSVEDTTHLTLTANYSATGGSGAYTIRVTAVATSGADEPTWPTEVGGTVSDGTVTWTVSYDYDYRLESTYHTFFSKSYRKRLVIPNYIVVESHPSHGDDFTGYAEDTASSDLMEIRKFIQLRLEDNAQATAIATARLSHYQLDAEKGAGFAPMNVGAEVYDFNKIKDSRQDDYRAGNIGYLNRHYTPGRFEFEFRFGSVEMGGGVGTLISTLGEPSFASLWTIIEQLWELIREILDFLETLEGYDLRGYIWVDASGNIHIRPKPGQDTISYEDFIVKVTNDANLGSATKEWLAGYIKKAYHDTRLQIPVGTNMYD